jgi:hypothetical protein
VRRQEDQGEVSRTALGAIRHAHLLGTRYNVDPVDYVSELDFTYGPEFFTQINQAQRT